MPGMLHGRVIHPPAIGAKLLAVDESLRAWHSGCPRRADGELSRGRGARTSGRRCAPPRALKATWSDGEDLPGSAGLDRTVREACRRARRDGREPGDPGGWHCLPAVDTSFPPPTTWPVPEPRLARPLLRGRRCRADGATIWTASQGPHGLRRNLAKVFAIPEDKLRVIFLDASGSYGTNGGDDAAAEPSSLSKTWGSPCGCSGSREDEHGWDPKGPAAGAGITRRSRCRSAYRRLGNADVVTGERAWARPFLAVDAAGMPQAHGLGERGRSRRMAIRRTRLPTSSAGALAEGDAVAAVESARAGQNRQCLRRGKLHRRDGRGLRSRSGRLPSARAHRSAGDRRAQARHGDARWQARPSPNPQPVQDNMLTGRGVAYTRYKQTENYVAMAMEWRSIRRVAGSACSASPVRTTAGWSSIPMGCATRSKGRSCKR